MTIQRLPRELLVMTLAMIVANLAGAMYYPILPLYLETLGATVQEVGLYFTLEVILSICFRILGGWISDNMGRLPTIALGGLLGLGAIIGFTLAPSWEWAILGALFGAMGSSLVGPSFQAYTAEQAPEGNVSSTYGLVNGLFLVCMIVGPLLGGFLAERFGFKIMLWVATGIFALATVMRVWMARRARLALGTLRPAGLLGELRGLLGLLLSGGLLLWLFVTDGLVDASTQLALPFLPKYVTEVGGLSETAYGALFALMSLVSAVAMWPGGMFADRFGERRSIALGVTLFGAAWALVILLPQAAVFGMAFALAGAGQAFVSPAFSALISKAVPRASLGITWGVFMTALGVLAIPAPYLGGLLYDNLRPEATFILAAACTLLAAPLALWKLHMPAPVAEAAGAPLTGSR